MAGKLYRIAGKRRAGLVIALTFVATVLSGCFPNRQTRQFSALPMQSSAANESHRSDQLRRGDPPISPCSPVSTVGSSPFDVNLTSLTAETTISLKLEEAIQLALANSKILRDLGGTVLRSPVSSTSTNDPAMTFTDPRFGEEAALAEFDAVVHSSAFFEKNDRQLNNRFFGNQGIFQQDLHNYQIGITKRSATGSTMSLRNFTTYDSNNQLSNAIGPSSFDQIVETEIRQPLLQGAGTEFNRIAGPGARPGQINGFLIGRVRTDISLTDFERAVRDLVADVENAYWDLHFAFRDLEARVDARDIALVTAKKLEAQTAVQGTGDTAQAMEQYYRFESDVIDSVNGRPIDGTRTNNGSAGGSFRGSGGLRVAERRLRLILGMDINDGKLIRPSDDPAQAPVLYDWGNSSSEALLKREEIRRQRWVIKQRELELLANRNFLKPQLDLVGRYRFRGFGKDLINYDDKSDAVSNMLDGNYQEWQAGLDYTLPVGFRKAFAAVRNSQLALHREAEVLKEQERIVLYGISNAMNEMKRSYDSMQLQEKRLGEIVRQLQSLQAKWESGKDPALDVLLDTHRRLLDARLRYHQSRVEYALAVRNVEFEKGSLLEFCKISLAD
jgi:Outer membrane efflux protein